MTLSNEAAYLYVYSKKLLVVNAKIKKYAKKAKKHREKHHQATKESKKIHHRIKHFHATKKLKSLIKDHNTILAKLTHHQVAFAHGLQLETKLK